MFKCIGWRKQPDSDLPDATSETKKGFDERSKYSVLIFAFLELPSETKIEPDSTSEGVSFGNSSNLSPRRSPDSQSDSSQAQNPTQTQIQPADSTTADAAKDEPVVKAEPTVKNEAQNEPTDEKCKDRDIDLKEKMCDHIKLTGCIARPKLLRWRIPFILDVYKNTGEGA